MAQPTDAEVAAAQVNDNQQPDHTGAYTPAWLRWTPVQPQ